MQQPEEAMRVFDEALAAAPDDPALHAAHVQLYIILADDAKNRGAMDEAEALLGEGLAHYADDGSLLYSLALLYEDQSRNRKAVEVLESLVADHPDNPAFLNALGYLLTDQFSRHKEARDYIQRALAMNPDSAAIIDSMGWVLFKLGDYRSALDYLERAYRLEPEPEIAAHVIETRWQLGDRDSARELLRTSLEQNPDDSHLKDVSERLAQ
jgi:tetratricopeptide (TPR) repeat protein